VPSDNLASTAASPTGAPLARLARDTTPDNPWPLRLLSSKIDDYVARMTHVWVEGQVVQFNRRPGSGMQYLSLRDTDADMSMSVSIFTRDLAALETTTGTQVTEGARVVVHAKPRFWAKRGSLELRADDIRPVGVGDLLARIEQLRRVLAAEGLFAPERKHPLPFLPRKVGLVCGRSAKAKDDVLVNARLRWPGLPFTVREVAVQGAQAVREVTAAIRELDGDDSIDVIVVARGGSWLDPAVTGTVLAHLDAGTGADAAQPPTSPSGPTDGAVPVVGAPSGPYEPLTGREDAVLALVCRGLSNAQIGERLHVAESTVKSHVKTILGKTGCHNRVELVIYALTTGLVQPQ